MEELHMIQYWVNKKGLLEAIEDYYPETLAKDPAIISAIHQLQNAERAINARIAEIQEAAEG
jgi:hypothetical protein